MKAKTKSGIIRVYNCSKQMISLQVKAPNGDFYTGEQQIRLNPGKDVTLPKSHVRTEQIENLQKKRMIKVIYDKE